MKGFVAFFSLLVFAGAIQAQIRERARGNLALLRRMGEETPGRLEMQEVEAGWSAVLALPGCVGEEDCAERLVRERGVVVQPGWFYGIGIGMAEANRVVVSLIGSPDELEAGMRISTAEDFIAQKMQFPDEPK